MAFSPTSTTRQLSSWLCFILNSHKSWSLALIFGFSRGELLQNLVWWDANRYHQALDLFYSILAILKPEQSTRIHVTRVRKSTERSSPFTIVEKLLTKGLDLERDYDLCKFSEQRWVLLLTFLQFELWNLYFLSSLQLFYVAVNCLNVAFHAWA